MREVLIASALILAGASAAHAQAAGMPAGCEALATLRLPNTTFSAARVVEAGQFVPPTIAPPPPAGSAPPAAAGPPKPAMALPIFRNLAAFCRVVAVLKPSNDSDITIEVWLPLQSWNGKFGAVGNGGWAGTISYAAMAAALSRGYATASTDTGHKGNGGDASFALNHPEKVTDFAYRAVHEMTVQAKAIIAAFYGNGPRLSYWNGCSTGGRQGLKEAQRYPTDFDGIIAGAPANYMTHLVTQSLWVAHATLKDPAAYIPREKFAVIKKAVMDRCDAADGVTDGVLENPMACGFDPAALRCQGEDAATCLTAAQVDAARKIYGGAKNPRTGAEIFPGLAAGSEQGWSALAGGPSPLSIADGHYKFVVFSDPKWDYRTLDFDKDVTLADKIDNGAMNAIDPDLRAFFGRGGKLLMYHGWNDQLIAPRNTIDYYNSVSDRLGGAARIADSMRLFMAPGMGHCSGGDGPNVFDAWVLLEEWVEQKKTPDRIIASRITDGAVTRTRPLCPYPQIAHYTGTGSTDDATNFVCRAP